MRIASITPGLVRPAKTPQNQTATATTNSHSEKTYWMQSTGIGG